MRCSTISLTLLLGCFTGCGDSATTTITLSKSTLEHGVSSYFPLRSDEYIEQELPVIVTASDPVVILKEGDDRIGMRMNIVAARANVAEASEAAKPNESQPAKTGLNPSERLLPERRPPFAPPAGELPGKPDLPRGIPKEIPVAAADSFAGSVTVMGKLLYKPEEGSFYFQYPTLEDVTFDVLPAPLEQPVRSGVRQLMSVYFNKHPVYTLSEEETKTRAAKKLLKSVQVRDGKLEVELGF